MLRIRSICKAGTARVFQRCFATAGSDVKQDWSKKIVQSGTTRKNSKNSAIKHQVKEFSKKNDSPMRDIDPVFIKRFTADSTYDPFDFSLTKIRLRKKSQS